MAFQFLKILNDAVKVLHSISQQVWKTQQWPEDWKRSVYISIPKKDNAKECSNYRTIALISHASKVMLKILQGGLQQYVDEELQKYKLDFEGVDELGTKLIICTGLWRKPESSRKTSTSASLTTQKPLIVWTTANYGKFLKKWECLTTLSISWEIKQQLELDME